MLYRFWLILMLAAMHPCAVQAQDSCYAFTSIKNYTRHNINKICNWEYVQPLNNNHFADQENEFYFFEPFDKRSLQYILKTYLLIYQQQAWYINTERLGIGRGFARVQTSGRYWVIKASTPQVNQENLALKYNESDGKFEQLTNVPNIRKIMYYAVNSVTLETTPLTFAGMLKLLNPYETLQMEFVKDKYNDDPYVIISYIKEINRYIDFSEKQKQQQENDSR